MPERILTDEVLAEGIVLSSKATPGPWIADGEAVPWKPRQRNPFADRGAGIVGPDDWEVVVGGLQGYEGGGAVGILTNEDAALIVWLRNNGPALIEEVRRLRTENERLRGRIAANPLVVTRVADEPARVWAKNVRGDLVMVTDLEQIDDLLGRSHD